MEAALRIALVTETYPPEVNGVAMTLSRLVGGLQTRGHRMQVVRPGQNRGDRSGTEDGVEHLVLPGLPLPGYPELRFGLPAILTLFRAWRQRRPDLVHVATEGPLGLAAIQQALALEIPVVSSFHTNFHSYGAHYGLGFFRDMGLSYLRTVHNATRRTFVPSLDVRRALEEEEFENVDILGRGVDTKLFGPHRRDPELRRSWGVESDATPVALYVGRLAAEKNLALTVRAWEVLRETEPDLRLVLVGDGPLRGELEKRFPEIHFAGMRRGEDLARHYASGELFLFASITETFGNVVTEALASGLVVCAFDYAAPGQYIRHGENGFLAPYGDGEAFVQSAQAALAARSRWPQVREAATASTAPLSWESILERYEKDVRGIATARPVVF